MERSQEEVAAQASERMDKSEYKRFCEHRADLIRAHEEHQKEVVKIYQTTASVFLQFQWHL